MGAGCYFKLKGEDKPYVRVVFKEVFEDNKNFWQEENLKNNASKKENTGL